MPALKIYISSSWKNRDRVRSLAEKLRAAGHVVYDFTDPKSRKTEEIPPEKFPVQYNPQVHASYSGYLEQPEWRSAVECNRDALDSCTACVLMLPCGDDAHSDWAYAVGRGKLSVVIGTQRAGTRTPTHLWADAIVDSDEEAVGWLAGAVPKPKPLDPHMNIGNICSRAYGNSKAHGFWDGDENQNIPTKLMLIVSEASEALEEYRSGVALDMTSVNDDGKPEGFPSELADIVIRVADLCGHLGIDLEEALRTKMAYNETRPHKHGNKRV